MSDAPNNPPGDLDKLRQEAAAAWTRVAKALKDRDEARAERAQIQAELDRLRGELAGHATQAEPPRSTPPGSGAAAQAAPSPQAPPTPQLATPRTPATPAARDPAPTSEPAGGWPRIEAAVAAADPGELEVLRREVERARVEIADLRVQLTRRTTEVDELRVRAEQNFADYQRSRARLTDLIAERDAARSVAQTYRDQLAQFEQESLSGQSERRQISEEIEFLKFALDRTVNEYAASRATLLQERDQARHETDELRRKLDNCIANSARMILEWKERAVRAEQTLDEIRKRVGPLFEPRSSGGNVDPPDAAEPG